MVKLEHSSDLIHKELSRLPLHTGGAANSPWLALGVFVKKRLNRLAIKLVFLSGAGAHRTIRRISC